MTHTERALVWRCGSDRLLGVLATPPAGAGSNETAVVIVVGGPQYRAGSHRQFTLLARELAAAGHPVLRFDCRGMGDSEGDPPGFEHIDDDIASAIDALLAHAPAVRRVVLWGLCDGASAALIYAGATRDARLAGLCLLNPWVRSAQSLAKAHVRHYYWQRLRQKDFWLKLLRGRVAVRAGIDLARDLGQAARPADAAHSQTSFQERMLQGLQAHAGGVLVVLSGDDITAQEFAQLVRDDARWAHAMAASRVQRLDLTQADHTFSNPQTQGEVFDATLRWLDGLTMPYAVDRSGLTRAASTVKAEARP